MYVPAHFSPDEALVDELLRNHGAADLVTVTPQGLVATMLPFVWEPSAGSHGALQGHVARNNDQWKLPVTGEALYRTALTGRLLPAGGAVIAILLGIGAGVFGIMGMGKKRKLKGLAIAGLILGIIAIIGGIILLG